MIKLSDLLFGVSIKSVVGDITSVMVNKVEFDSRKVSDSDLFIAIKGVNVDGHSFIDLSVADGAKSVIVEEIPEKINKEICYVQVDCSSSSMSVVSSNYYDNPSSKIKLVGVTGTNGKTTIVTLLHQLFSELGYPTGMLSTIENKIGTRSVESTHTTGDSLQINKLLSEMVLAGCEYCFMEVSSHAIHQNRVSSLVFEGGIFTNITHEHIDYHKDFKEYISVKKRFFNNLKTSAFALTNKDDKNGNVMISNTKARKITYSLKSMADYKCKVLESRLDGMLLNIQNHEIWVKIIGEFNAYNLLAIYSTSVELGLDKDRVLERISILNPAEGRFHTIRNSENITGIVDYMHTPDAYENVLSTINSIRTNTEKLIVVFGCGGDRDAEKRPKMTAIACNMSDQVIITADNPRTEKIEDIISDMTVKLDPVQKKKVLVITDRSQAIKTACTLASEGDIVLLAGKGHEKYQEIEGVKHYFDDVEELVESLNINQ
ncbi:MAG: UDP-N-acetylmuramoyl-L-alanyl-D-glutamate--2,6-diaminopimelate ligase [Flavobacteriales bacterium]|jgi:UDP-N-acetylmuramoyl-L-alanyl-D-glutamate--2,6-diaminopimelate ligase|nr:UDP-N-acetylmuramoyl-L-alanyl-D-glutamate--2,6-diaminopimelate ligase [Flavobacteriales bacterium]MBT7620541.1 UDP-N-acetylmuramoyl-L-alanyl-D-glutamate--2,6-diaminopimelate ligase [Flavobacteriales bacterium]MDG2058746.1 UDP-N-acetylmuramoyl-L-alanyl-D-glutamate--2,6-diaminopimelate ligase [Flavobacteriales bacterium]